MTGKGSLLSLNVSYVRSYRRRTLVEPSKKGTKRQSRRSTVIASCLPAIVVRIACSRARIVARNKRERDSPLFRHHLRVFFTWTWTLVDRAEKRRERDHCAGTTVTASLTVCWCSDSDSGVVCERTAPLRTNERTNEQTDTWRGQGEEGEEEEEDRDAVAPGPEEELAARDTKKRASGIAVVI